MYLGMHAHARARARTHTHTRARIHTHTHAAAAADRHTHKTHATGIALDHFRKTEREQREQIHREFSE